MIKGLVVTRKVTSKNEIKKDKIEYLILNGPNMGKWKFNYDITCIADIYDCKEFARNIIKENPEYQLHEVDIIQPTHT